VSTSAVDTWREVEIWTRNSTMIFSSKFRYYL